MSVSSVPRLASIATMLDRLSSSLPSQDAVVGARFLWSLPGFLRHPLGLEQAHAILRRRLERRETDFLALVRWAIYGQAASPYRELLTLVGCEYGDLERLVRQEGLEGALHILYRRGVYLSLDEFKGRRPAVRGSATIAANPGRLRNPAKVSHVPVQSSGSRGAATPATIDLASVREQAVDDCLALDARGDRDWLHAFWAVPGSSAMFQLLKLSAFGHPAVRWFSQVDPAAQGLHPRYRWSARAMRWGSVLAGAPLPGPQYVPLEDPLPIARWLTAALRAGRTPHLNTYASSAVRLCQTARAHGLDLRGAQLTVGSEPITAARLAAIRSAGAAATPSYGAAECGSIAKGCSNPEAPDDVHLLTDLHALIQPGFDGATAGLPPDALLVSSLRARARFILMNVSLGDQAVMVRRSCGCPMERLGWVSRLHTIRSYEKLTAGGMTFRDTDVIRVLEEVLPARFGGGPTDYQLLEEDGEDGQPRLRLLVHPTVGPLDPVRVRQALLSTIGAGSGVERMMGLLWQQAEVLRVERRAPQVTGAGNILHLHQARQSPRRGPREQRADNSGS